MNIIQMNNILPVAIMGLIFALLTYYNSNNEAVLITSSGLTKGQTLYKNTTATLKVRIEYNSSYEGDASGTSGESTVDLEFVQ